MAMDMKAIIAEVTVKLLSEKSKKKITVRDIVEECNITRQAFYYHFADIPELFNWIISQRVDSIMSELDRLPSVEEKLRYTILIGINSKEGLVNGISTNYGKQFGEIVHRQIFSMFMRMVDRSEECRNLSDFEKKFFVRYHFSAIIGMLADWTDEDTKNLDMIVHGIYLILSNHAKGL